MGKCRVYQRQAFGLKVTRRGDAQGFAYFGKYIAVDDEAPTSSSTLTVQRCPVNHLTSQHLACIRINDMQYSVASLAPCFGLRPANMDLKTAH